MKHFGAMSIFQAILCLTFCITIETRAVPLEKRDASTAIAEIDALLEDVSLLFMVGRCRNRRI
jgi:hypothetical protein